MQEDRRVRHLIARSDLKSFFHEAISEAVTRRRLETDDATILYLTNLLTDFTRSERLFDQDVEGVRLPALVHLYQHAVEASSQRERTLFLRRLGDIALFVSGLFSGYFKRRLIDVDYYIAMGQGAYGYLGEEQGPSQSSEALITVFRDLSSRFLNFVDVLADVGDREETPANREILRLYEEWARTGSPFLERRLRRYGINPEQLVTAH